MGARERILDAAADVMRRDGVARATTKEIAKAAGYSEALLYKHFRDKEELMLHVLKERMPAFTASHAAGEGTVEGNLVAVVHGALRFYRAAFPMMVSMVAQPRLMETMRDSLRKYGAGPREPVLALARYLDAERELGRVAAGADTGAVAALLMGACFQQGFLRYFAEGPAGSDPPESAARDLVRPVLAELAPGAKAPGGS
ncbi:TetR/AcrR family transcriptional regulator [Actinomadura sp. 7K534]|uniref:TetR/AcrR family transcriptional regulator n=1 Tax=Actinomadura sp. 7K534 TaxID=2530366 RepID=UPI0010504308|nr:TetR/AcrR family transcriptional regulator [Actinomadura sp. 7K534]TDB96005.1 TetR/AcrR family transcriptional regulator [Actinomadura sp. 7K534]